MLMKVCSHVILINATYRKVWVEGRVLHYKPGAIGNQKI